MKAPKKLSEAILLALSDLEQIEQNKDYVINMNKWHEPIGDKCHVCFAGSVMVNTKKIKKNDFIFSPSYKVGQFSKIWQRVFYSLNNIRLGQIDEAIASFYNKNLWQVSSPTGENELTYNNIINFGMNENEFMYRENPQLFKDFMIDIAMYLESEGL